MNASDWSELKWFLGQRKSMADGEYKMYFDDQFLDPEKQCWTGEQPSLMAVQRAQSVLIENILFKMEGLEKA